MTRGVAGHDRRRGASGRAPSRSLQRQVVRAPSGRRPSRTCGPRRSQFSCLTVTDGTVGTESRLGDGETLSRRGGRLLVAPQRGSRKRRSAHAESRQQSRTRRAPRVASHRGGRAKNGKRGEAPRATWKVSFQVQVRACAVQIAIFLFIF